MKAFTLLAALVASAAAAPPTEPLDKRDSSLQVKLEMLGNSEVKATLTNRGNSGLKVLKIGSILDQSPIEKVKVFSGDQPVGFQGARLRIAAGALEEEDFTRIAAGESVEAMFDIATSHDLSAGGKFGVVADGALSVAEEGGTEIVGSVPFVSNKMEAEVDGAQAAAVHTAFHDKRTRVQSDCQGQQLAVTQMALRNCASISRQAQQAAASGPADKVEEYFKSSSAQVRNTVAGVFERVAAECGTTDSGVSDYYCSDVWGYCDGPVLAYTMPSLSIMVYCPLYFQALPDVTTRCHAQDKAGTNIHEATHLTQIKGTDDYGGYGYGFMRSLSGAQNLNHADTYALFANAVSLGC